MFKVYSAENIFIISPEISDFYLSLIIQDTDRCLIHPHIKYLLYNDRLNSKNELNRVQQGKNLILV